jgi:transcriptional regulator with XRE-family HTH domain
MIERIQMIMKSRNISAAQFADEIGVQRSSVSHILTGRNNPSLDIVLKILQRFPEINSDWILTGNGAMLKSKNVNSNVVQPLEQTANLLRENSGQKKENLGDLFDQQTIQVDKDDSINKNITKQLLSKTENEAEDDNNETGEKIKKPEEIKQNTSFRTIEQIVIFYSDKTFSYYVPNN